MASSDIDDDYNDHEDALEVAPQSTSASSSTTMDGDDGVEEQVKEAHASVKQRNNNNKMSLATTTNEGDNNNSANGHDDPNGYSKPPSAFWKCCISLRNCTGIFIVLGIVNVITVLLLSGIGYMLGAILEHAGSDIRYRYRSIDILVIIISQFCCLGTNLLALYCLCKRFNSSGRDYKAAVAAFGCSCCFKEQRRIYPEAIRPIRDVVSDIWDSVPILHCNCWTLLMFIGFFFLGIILCDIMYWSNQGELLVYVCLFSCLVWISVGVFIWKINEGFDQLLQSQELELQQKQASSASSSPQKDDEGKGVIMSKEVEMLQVV